MPPRSLSSPIASDDLGRDTSSHDASPLVSVIVPFANDDSHLPRTLANLAQLDYPSLDFIFVNDASADSSPELVQEWISALPNSSQAWSARMTGASRSAVVRTPVAEGTDSGTRVGVALAREQGVAQARGEWVWFCDSDDTFSPQIVSDMVAASENVDLVACRAVHIEPSGRERLMEGFDTPTLLTREQLFMAIVGGQVRGYLWNKLFRRSVLEAAIADIAAANASANKPTRLTSQSDFLLVTAVAEHAGAHTVERNKANSFAARCIPTVGYHYRERAASISTGADLKIANTATCADHFVEKLDGALQQSEVPPWLQAQAAEYFRTWFYRVPCFTTPTHQRWDKRRRRDVQRSIVAEFTGVGLARVAQGIPELQLPAMPRIAVHGVIQKVFGPIGLYDLSYAMLRKGISAAHSMTQTIRRIRGNGAAIDAEAKDRDA